MKIIELVRCLVKKMFGKHEQQGNFHNPVEGYYFTDGRAASITYYDTIEPPANDATNYAHLKVHENAVTVTLENVAGFIEAVTEFINYFTNTINKAYETIRDAIAEVLSIAEKQKYRFVARIGYAIKMKGNTTHVRRTIPP